MGQPGGEILALCVGNLAALDDGNHFAFFDGFAETLVQFRDGSEQLDGNARDTVRTWNNCTGHGEAAHQYAPANGGGFDSRRGYLSFTQFDGRVVIVVVVARVFVLFGRHVVRGAGRREPGKAGPACKLRSHSTRNAAANGRNTDTNSCGDGAKRDARKQYEGACHGYFIVRHAAWAAGQEISWRGARSALPEQRRRRSAR